MADDFVTLNCCNCGGKLHVFDDLERFACGYCGSSMIVQRRGGTVALKAVEEAIKRVQAGTDRTAAELALVRLERELNELELAEQSIAKAAFPTPNVPAEDSLLFQSLIFLMVCGGVLSVAVGVIYALRVETLVSALVLLMFGLLSSGFGGFAIYRNVRQLREWERRCSIEKREWHAQKAERLSSARERTARIRTQIAAARAIVDE